MAIYLALDDIDGFSLTEASLIVGINATQAGLRAAGFTAVRGYRNDRLRSIDETDEDVWDILCAPGWYWTAADGVQERPPLTHAQQVAQDIGDFQDAVEREAVEWERVIAEESFSPHTDSGHLWTDDLLHALLKPNIRGLERLLADAKATPSATTITAYRLRLDSFIAIAREPGVRDIYRAANKSVWRPLRAGAYAYGYDTATGGIRRAGVPPEDVRFAVEYPDGETVVTWDALAAVRAL